MDWDKSNILSKWFSNLAVSYNEFRKESHGYRCKIVNIENDQVENDVKIFVLINGIKKQVIPYFSRELVIDDSMLIEFSSFDVRAITFYAMQQYYKQNDSVPVCSIDRQEFSNGKTIFIIKKSYWHF